MKKIAWIACWMALLLPLMLLVSEVTAHAEGQPRWEGVDKAVVERYAEAHDRKARSPLLGEEGDLLLFCFALGGALGGFLLGYNWRILFKEKQEDGSGRRPVSAR